MLKIVVRPCLENYFIVSFSIVITMHLFQLIVGVFLLTLSVLMETSEGKTVYYHLTASYFEGSPDGVRSRILGFNNQFPGPTIRAAKNDILVISVTNSIAPGIGTSIHFHGFEQYLTPWEDGPRMITQCDIPFNYTHTYKFRAVQSGTYWYHSHHTGQYGEGLWGVLIIDNVPEVHKYDGEFVLALNVWFHLSSNEMTEWYEDGSRSRGEMPIPDSLLINGMGYYPCEFAAKKNLSCNPELRERYPLLEVERGKTYRFRIIEASLITSKIFSIDGHKLETIETDGVDTVRVAGVDSAHVSTATRHSFLVTMNGKEDQYWIRVRANMVPYKMNYPNINPYPEAFQQEVLAVLKYKDELSNEIEIGDSITFWREGNRVENRILSDPPTAVQGRPELKGTSRYFFIHKPFQVLPSDALQVDGFTYFYDEPLKFPMATSPFPSSQPLPADESREMDIMDCHPFGGGRAPNYVNQTVVISIPNLDHPDVVNKMGFNNITYSTKNLDKPALVKLVMDEELPEDLHPIEIQGFGDDYIVEVIFNDFGDSGHPIHLHGHTFWVMGSGDPDSGPFSEEEHRPLLRSGARRETVSVRNGAWLVIRFRANSPGLWLLHCHMNFHHEAALGLIFVEGRDIAREIYKDIPHKIMDVCAAAGVKLDDDDETEDDHQNHVGTETASGSAMQRNYITATISIVTIMYMFK